MNVTEIRKAQKLGEPLGGIYPKLDLAAKKGLFLLGIFKGTTQGMKDDETFNNHNFTVIETDAKARTGKDKGAGFAPKPGELVTLRGSKFDRVFLPGTPTAGKYLIEYIGEVEIGKAQPMHDYSIEPVIS